ncbi:MAG: hypothetical protein IKI58_11965 [Oscillospiraceae bacterium]|nr:hypothetical protein [Oscillospiraceae bacterium]
MTNREYFLTYCVKQDLCAIYRYAMLELKMKFESKPLWEKKELFEKWLEQPLDADKWNYARTRVKT